MAKIQVNEKDLSWYYRTRDPGVLTVLTPILSSWGPYTPTLVNYDNFTEVYGDALSPEDLSYPMAKSLAKSGVTILGMRINIPDSVEAIYDPTENGWELNFPIWTPTLEGTRSSKRGQARSTTQEDINVPPLVIMAKYDGSYGNNFRVVCKRCSITIADGATTPSSIIIYVDVYNTKTGKTLESLVYELVDQGSPYYWDIVNRQSQYIELAPPVTDQMDGNSKSAKDDSTRSAVKSFMPDVDYPYVDVASLYTYFQDYGSMSPIFAVNLVNGADASDSSGLGYINENDEFVFVYNRKIITEIMAEHFYTPGVAPTYSSDNGGGGTEEATYSIQTSTRSVPSDPEQYLQYLVSSTYVTLADIYNVDFDIAISGGYTDLVLDENTGLYHSALDAFFLSLVKARGTAVYLVDSDVTESAIDFFTRCGQAEYDECSFDYEPFIGSEPLASQINNLNASLVAKMSYVGASSYCAAYGPWCYAQLLDTGISKLLPGSYVMLTAWARALTNGVPAYLAPAGVVRASLGKIITNTVYPVGSSVIDYWQNHDWTNTNALYKVNPIARLRSYGYVVYGNSTLLKNDVVTGATSMLQSVSTRLVANMIKRRAIDVAMSLQFDQIDDHLFASFNTQMSAFMDELKYGGALYSYKIVADYAEMTYDDLNQRTVPVKILISPNPAAENFIIDLEIHPSGVTFGDDTAANTRLPLQ